MSRGQAVVVGAGVVGLACADSLARAGWDVALIDREETYGRGTSSRNSEVIHAGIYYAPGSLKAALCLEGKERLYRYAAERGVPHRRCGKLIVANDTGEVTRLESLLARAVANGVTDLEWVDGDQVAAMEPSVRAIAALLSPGTGIIDVHELMHALAADAVRHGVDMVYRSELVGAVRRSHGWELSIRDPAGEIDVFGADLVVNSAGLHSDAVASLVLDAEAQAEIQMGWVKGSYFGIRSGSSVRATRLIYPAPHEELKGLGVHLTLDLAGMQRLGPDVEVLPERREMFDVDGGRAASFAEAAQRYLPGLRVDDLIPGYSGLRPQLTRSGFRDFYLAEESARGAPGWINLVAIESPGSDMCSGAGGTCGANFGRVRLKACRVGCAILRRWRVLCRQPASVSPLPHHCGALQFNY